MLTPPFTAGDLLKAAPGAFQLPENAPQLRSKPRASAIGGCSRQNAYMMANVDKEGDTGGSTYTTEQGRLAEDITCKIVEHLDVPRPLVVSYRQVSLPESMWASGHPDGYIMYRDQCLDGPDGWELKDGGDPHLDDGLVWGFEHKQPGRWGYETSFKKGFWESNRGYTAQALTYGVGLGWDAVMVVVVSQDSSSTNSDARINLKSKKPAVRWANDPLWDPKVLVYTMDLREAVPMAKLVEQRARWLTKHMESGEAGDVYREHDPLDESRESFYADEAGKIFSTRGPQFPCSYCDWRDKCIEDGEGEAVCPALPFGAI